MNSCKTINKISILLKTPQKPSVTINESLIHFKGNLKASVSFFVISDYECDMCRENHSIFDSIYNHYKSKIKFGFINYGSYVSLSAIASECANNQGRFWEFHDSIFNAKTIFDTTKIFKVAKSLDLDITKFKSDFYGELITKKLENNLLLIRGYGIYGTPTVVINNHVIFNSSSLKEIVKILEDEINKN